MKIVYDGTGLDHFVIGGTGEGGKELKSTTDTLSNWSCRTLYFLVDTVRECN